MNQVTGELQEHRGRHQSLEATIAQTKEIAQEMKTNAEREAQLLVAEAELHAENILGQAHNRLAQIHDDIAELKRQRAQFEVRFALLGGSPPQVHGCGTRPRPRVCRA